VAQLENTRERPDRPDELLIDHTPWTRKDEIKESIHVMLSHHPPSLFGHCLRLSIKGHSIYFCARCSGIYGGLFIGVVALFLWRLSLEPSWLWFLIALGMGLTTIIEWTTQRLTPRKTRNLLRVTTGFMSGVALAIVFWLGNVYYMLVALIVMASSVGGVGLIENRKMKKQWDLESEQDDFTED
jgi:uncharacterized membrane protein